jgi:hypothetical protein
MRAVTLGISLEVRPKLDRSVEHPVVTFVTTAERVALLQAGALHRLVSQLLMGVTIDEFAPPATRVTRDPGLKHAAASGFVAMFVSAVVQAVESDCADA